LLVEIKCDKFTEKVISFEEGLNIVLGDESGANSIGKSSLLMLVDFCFGGDSYLEHNSDTVTHLGHQTYYFKFKFGENELLFSRGTENSDTVIKFDNKNEVEMELSDFKKFLKKSYGITQSDLTFRELVGLYSRIWGKENQDVKYPLSVAKGDGQKAGILRLIKAFDLYAGLKEEIDKFKKKDSEKKALASAQRNKLIPEINKTQLNRNLKEIEKENANLDEIKDELAKFAVSITEIKNKEILELKSEKDNLLRQKMTLESRLNRVKLNLEGTRKVKAKKFEVLKKYVSTLDTEKLAEVESFHSKISDILKSEFKLAKKSLEEQVLALNDRVIGLDEKVNAIINKPDTPNHIIDRVLDVSKKIKDYETQNFYYNEKVALKNDVKDLSDDLEAKKEKALNGLCTKLNEEISNLVEILYEKGRKSPVFTASGNSYSYNVIDDTGTGKAYSNLVVFDMAVLNLSNLPFLIHDSFLFKNIENKAVEQSLSVYSNFNKQVFISIDEKGKFSKKTQDLIDNNKSITLSKNSLLFIKDWRSEK
jgi:hypothetical protein